LPPNAECWRICILHQRVDKLAPDDGEPKREKISRAESLVCVPPGVNVINILRAHFSYKSASSQIFSSYGLAKKALLNEKLVHKKLMKLTEGVREKSEGVSQICD